MREQIIKECMEAQQNIIEVVDELDLEKEERDRLIELAVGGIELLTKAQLSALDAMSGIMTEGKEVIH